MIQPILLPLSDPSAQQYDLSSLRTCLSAAEPLPPETWRRWKETLQRYVLRDAPAG